MRVYVVNHRDGFIHFTPYNAHEKEHVVIEDGSFVEVNGDKIKDADIDK